jgi:histidyl-tRNA synthetase
MAKTRKPKIRRPSALPPKGFRDYFGAEVVERNQMLAKIAEVYHRYGFDPLESSAVETVEALGKFLPDVDRPNEGVFAWQEDAEGDKPGDWLALRYDLTAPLARVFAQHRNDLPTPYRRYAMGPVWRNEKPGPGRFRQFYQCDADTVGSGSVAADAEICTMLADTLEAVGIERGDYIIRVNNRKVLNGVLTSVTRGIENNILSEMSQSELAEYKEFEAKGLADDPALDSIMRTLDKFDKVGVEGIRELLTGGRRDQSGAFIDGVNLSNKMAEGFIDFLSARGSSNKETIARLRQVLSYSAVGQEGIDELETIADLLTAQGYGPDRIVIDPSVVRGLGYYTGPVFEAELTFEILDEKGRKRQFGSVAGGGRYDDLVKRFTGQEVPGTGVSIGVDRLLAALREKGRIESAAAGPVVVTVMDKSRMADYQAMVAELRNAGIRAEVYLGNPKSFGTQMKYADKRNSPVAVIEGTDEHERGVVQIKDLALGARLAGEMTTNEEWKSQPAQMEIKRGDLVAEVRKMIARGEPKTSEAGWI